MIQKLKPLKWWENIDESGPGRYSLVQKPFQQYSPRRILSRCWPIFRISWHNAWGTLSHEFATSAQNQHQDFMVWFNAPQPTYICSDLRSNQWSERLRTKLQLLKWLEILEPISNRVFYSYSVIKQYFFKRTKVLESLGSIFSLSSCIMVSQVPQIVYIVVDDP